MMKSIVSMAACVVLTGSLWAETFVLTKAPSSLAEWKDGSFYEGGKAPSGAAADTVATKNDENLVIELDGTNEDGENNAIFRFLGGMKSVILSNAVMRVTVPEGDVATLNCAVYDSGTQTGTIEKHGKGELFLAARLKASTANVIDFESHLHVFEGAVRLTTAAESGHKYHMFHSVNIEKPAKVITLSNECVWQMRGLCGEGMITNEASSKCTLYITAGREAFDGGVFAGTIGGNIAVEARGCKIALTGMASTFSGGVTGTTLNGHGAEIHLTDFGEKSRECSSVGLGSVELALSSHPFVYEGLGQTTDRDFQLNYLNSVLSAGTNGNLVYEGRLNRWTATKHNISLFLSGDNKFPSVFAAYGPNADGAIGEFAGMVDSQPVTCNYYFGKRGSGEWHFPLTGRFRNTGVFAVENGTLSYETIDRAGELTALGYSTRLFDNVSNPTEDAKVDYAFLLGSESEADVGLMSCTTNLARQCTDRPFGLKGRGGFAANDGLVKYANVFGVGDGERTLILTGTNEFENEVHDVVDHREGSADTAVVSVEKNGPGTWVLGGDQKFSGSLTVNGGKLIVRRAAQNYCRYRLVVMALACNDADFGGDPANTETRLHLAEIGLYAADNSRQNLNLRYSPTYADMAPGECALGLNRVISSITSGPYNVFELLFDGYRKRDNDEAGSVASWHAIHQQTFMSEGKIMATAAPVYGQPNTYLPFDMYLPDGAQPIHHFDILSSSKDVTYVPSRVQLLASVDGIHWDQVSAVEKISGVKSSNNYWLSDGSGSGGFEDGGLPTTFITSQTKSSGWTTTKTVPTKVFSLLENVGAVTVANGASLKYEGEAAEAPALSRVKLAADATGSIDGFRFAKEGTFEIDVMGKSGAVVNVELPNAMGLNNMANWQVKVGQTLKSGYRVKATAEGLTVSRAGMVVVIR